MPIYSLANEELDAIFQHLAHDTLRAICLTSRRSSEIGTRNLYAILDLFSVRRKMAVASTLMHHRELGEHARVLLVQASAHDDEDLMNSLLLTVMPNLHSAHFRVWASSALLTWLADTESCPAGLRNITSLHLVREGFEVGFDLQDIATCLFHPNLQKLAIRTIYDDREDEEVHERLVARRGTSNVTDLSLAFLDVFSNRALEAVLSVPKQVKRLSVNPMERGGTLDASALFRVLETSHGCLEFLRIADGFHAKSQEAYPTFPSDALSRFSVIKELQVHLTMLITRSGSGSKNASVISLPDTLEHLTVCWDHAASVNTDAFLKMLSADRPKAMQGLRIRGIKERTEIVVRPNGSIGFADDELALTLREACLKVGVKFEDERRGFP